jgi:hypothetical protein
MPPSVELYLIGSSPGVYHRNRLKDALIWSCSDKQFPMAFGDDFDCSVDHFEGGLIVNRCLGFFERMATLYVEQLARSPTVPSAGIALEASENGRRGCKASSPLIPFPALASPV